MARRPTRSLTVFALVVGIAAAAIPEPRAEDLILIRDGKLPLIVSAPHGGLAEVPGVAPRRGENIPLGGKGFSAGRDTNTDRLAEAFAAAVEAKTGRPPYLVVANFHRKYLDVNRPAEIGCEDPKAKAVYDQYHAALVKACRAVQKEFGRGLLLDIHGQGLARDTVFRGTQNGRTVTLLTQRFGSKAHAGPESLFGLMATAGWDAQPSDASGEQAGYTGGFIVQTYGSHTGFGIDAIQLEFGAAFRSRANVAKTAKTLADVVDDFARRYLPDRPLAKAG